MRLIVLGSNGTYPTPGRPASGYLVTSDETTVLLDCGPGVFTALLEHGVGTFVYTKLAITGFGLVFLVVHAAFWIADTIRVSHILYALLGGYVTLCGYQLEMLARVF